MSQTTWGPIQIFCKQKLGVYQAGITLLKKFLIFWLLFSEIVKSSLPMTFLSFLDCLYFP